MKPHQRRDRTLALTLLGLSVGAQAESSAPNPGAAVTTSLRNAAARHDRGCLATQIAWPRRRGG